MTGFGLEGLGRVGEGHGGDQCGTLMGQHVAGVDEDAAFAVLAEAILVESVTRLGLVGRHLGDAQFVFAVSIATVPARRTSIGRRQKVPAKLGLVVALGTQERLGGVPINGRVGRHDEEIRASTRKKYGKRQD